ncbi:hypothetical protein PIB30_021573 [Stylosanthes scabra]|uniref:Uncharacterized protein n=1 Tax=Stylosanthes scabra TaxID=79078 RepID=A0ABU6TAX2_9FABA|nr:hypothetical protein [Stylosanthes scabra]
MVNNSSASNMGCMTNNFSQYTVAAVLLLLLTASSVPMVTAEANSEVCRKDGGGVEDDNCSSLKQLQENRCNEKLYMAGAPKRTCDPTWCVNACKLKHFGQQAQGRCFPYYTHPN